MPKISSKLPHIIHCCANSRSPACSSMHWAHMLRGDSHCAAFSTMAGVMCTLQSVRDALGGGATLTPPDKTQLHSAEGLHKPSLKLWLSFRKGLMHKNLPLRIENVSVFGSITFTVEHTKMVASLQEVSVCFMGIICEEWA